MTPKEALEIIEDERYALPILRDFDDAVAIVRKALTELEELKSWKNELSDRINNLVKKRRHWVEKNQSYADFIATKSQASHLISDAIIRADTLGNDWAVNALKVLQDQTIKDTSNQPKGFVLHHNWVVNTPMETGIAPKENAIKALNTAKQFSNPFGMYVTGIDKNVKRDAGEYSYGVS